MAITLELDGRGARVVDTARPATAPIDLAAALTVTQWKRATISIGAGVANQALNFDGITAAQALIVRTVGGATVGHVSIKVNGSATAMPVNPLFVDLDSEGGIASATISNATGAAIVIEVLIGG